MENGDKELEKLMSFSDGCGDSSGGVSFERHPIDEEQLFREIRTKLIMNLHKVTREVAVMMMKANDLPKRKENNG